MKLTISPTSKLAMFLAAFCAVTLAFSQNASAYKVPMPPSINLVIGDSHELGFVNFGIPSGDSDRLAYVNHLIGMALGSQDDAFGQHFTRSNNAFSPLPQAVLAGHVNGTSTTINLGSGLYTYLFAKYDGPNYGSEVWYVGNLSGIITIPATAGGYGLSGWTLFGTGVPGVPDGGITAMLLGTALGALGMARRVLKI
jgi:VPDSG-CTERM exosortase interaction domain